MSSFRRATPVRTSVLASLISGTTARSRGRPAASVSGWAWTPAISSTASRPPASSAWRRRATMSWRWGRRWSGSSATNSRSAPNSRAPRRRTWICSLASSGARRRQVRHRPRLDARLRRARRRVRRQPVVIEIGVSIDV